MEPNHPVRGQRSTGASLQDCESKLPVAPRRLHEQRDLPVGLPSAAETSVLAPLQVSLPVSPSPRSRCAQTLSRPVPVAEKRLCSPVKESSLWPQLRPGCNLDL